MPTQNGIGYGPCTAQKVKDFSVIIDYHIGLTFATRNKTYYWRDYPYHYIDATAGSGECPELKLKGSPLLFLDAIGRRPFRADFIERVDVNIQALAQRIPDTCRPFVHLHGGEYESTMPNLLALNLPLGLVFVDPTGEKPDLTTLKSVARLRRYKEILLYVPAAIIKRCLHIPGHERLADYIEGVNKRYWLIREPSGKEQWTFLLGTNTDNFKDYKAIGLYRIDSPHGEEILNHLNYTTKEREQWQQPSLPLIEPMMNTSDTQPIEQLGQRR